MNPTTTQPPYMFPHMVPVMQPSFTHKMEKYKSLMINFGITEIVLAGICIVCDIVVLSIYYDLGQGIWCGSVLLACGIVGVLTKPTPCMYNANMAMSIISALAMCVLFSFSIIFALDWYVGAEIVALQSVLAVASFTALIINIMHSAYCCASVCTTSTPTHIMVPMQFQNGQVVLQPQPQLMSYPTNAAYLGPYNPVSAMPISGVHPQANVTAGVPPAGMLNTAMAMTPSALPIQPQSNSTERGVSSAVPAQPTRF